jgi:hypothetical protein
MTTKPDFTYEQEQWLCEVIGELYLKWKNNIAQEGATHRLGFAKEELKGWICNRDKGIKN